MESDGHFLCIFVYLLAKLFLLVLIIQSISKPLQFIYHRSSSGILCSILFCQFSRNLLSSRLCCYFFQSLDYILVITPVFRSISLPVRYVCQYLQASVRIHDKQLLSIGIYNIFIVRIRSTIYLFSVEPDCFIIITLLLLVTFFCCFKY